MLINEKAKPIVTLLCIRGSELDAFMIFITQLYNVAAKNLR